MSNVIGRVLVLDTDEGVRRALEAALQHVAVTSSSAVEEAVQLCRESAFDLVIWDAGARKALAAAGREQPVAVDGASGAKMVVESKEMAAVMQTVHKVANYKSTVLVLGESGTGKELVARALHREGSRARKPFVAVNCGAIPESLLESELFGHRRGAFTDAVADKVGLFSEADGGTIFLDEIGELPLALQVKLLRVLQEEEIRPVGDARSSKVDVRVVAATARDLPQEVLAGGFREDLYYRLNVVPIVLPPLRERTEDIGPLVEHFIRANNERLGRMVKGVSTQARELLLRYRWPGNVRELENTIEHAMVLAESNVIEADALPAKLRDTEESVMGVLAAGDLSIKRTARLLESELIRRALHQTDGNRTNASKLLEISHRALLYKLKEYGIDL